MPSIRFYWPSILEAQKDTTFEDFFKELLENLQKAGERTSVEKIPKMIIELCALRPLRFLELVEILQRDSDHLRKRYLSKMIEEEEVEYQFPESPKHSFQAYKATKSLKD